MSAPTLAAPACRACGVQLVHRAHNIQTPEQLWCGEWFDHPPTPGRYLFGHTTTHLIPSPALAAMNPALTSNGTR